MPRFLRSASGVAAALACLSLPAAAIAQDQRCVSRAESQAVVAHLMPNLLRSVSQKCAAFAGRDSFLQNGASDLSDRVQPLSRQSWPAAKRALERQGGTALPDNEALLNFGREAIANGVASGLDRNECQMVDSLLEQLAPLPPRNLANVFALFLEAGLNNTKDSPLKVCPAV
jgi:hypothetical protein